MCQWPELIWEDEHTDVALLRLDFGRNKEKDWLSGHTSFPFVPISTRVLDEAEPVYSFGYPLSEGGIVGSDSSITVGTTSLAPRTTSAIVASLLDRTKMAMSGADTAFYVLDKALNYGNSGGPIVATETGNVHAICTRFQPVWIPQEHMTEEGEEPPFVKIPSLYGVVTRLTNRQVMDALRAADVPTTDS